MSADWLGEMLDEMLDETKWESVIDCVNCGHVPAHSPYCKPPQDEKCLTCGGEGCDK